MENNKINNLIVPLRQNGEKITLEDEEFEIKENLCSHYLKNEKVLLLEGFTNKNFFFKSTVIRAIEPGQKKPKCCVILY
jgi:hypothetical protein